MTITKILTRKSRLDMGIRYVLNGDRAREQIFAARLNCGPDHEYRRMLETKRAMGKEGGVQYYHFARSFQSGEATPGLTLEIARKFAEERLPGHQTVIGIRVDEEHIHTHILFSSANTGTGERYYSNAQSYYRQVQVISDRLCRGRGLSALLQGKSTQAVSYIEWLRRSRGQPTFRSMLEEDLHAVIADTNNLSHFSLPMEHMGYEIGHRNRLGFCLRRQGHFVVPGRKNPLSTEDGIRAAIQRNLAAIKVGRQPAIQFRSQYHPYQRYPRYTDFLALHIYYLYLLGKVGKRQYPSRMTPQPWQKVIRFEQCREQLVLLRGNGIMARTDIAAFTARIEGILANLMKQRTVLSIRKKQRRTLYTALADAEALAPVRELCEAGLSDMETELAQYTDAMAILRQCGVPREGLTQKRAELYDRLAELNRWIRTERGKLTLCWKTQNSLPQTEQEVGEAEVRENEVRTNGHRRR